ncbi:MAG: response regulator transcription factor [Chloroflexota bacterium]
MATVLVVDDELPLRSLLAMVIRDAGHAVILAIDGSQALEVIGRQRPDLVLSDIMMPLLNGAALCRGLKLAADTASIPVILMSAAGNALAEGTGADAFLAKPFDIADVEALLDRWLP